jgi:hypothetical protein
VTAEASERVHEFLTIMGITQQRRVNRLQRDIQTRLLLTSSINQAKWTLAN